MMESNTPVPMFFATKTLSLIKTTKKSSLQIVRIYNRQKKRTLQIVCKIRVSCLLCVGYTLMRLVR